MNPNEEQVVFYHQIGTAITQWAHVENALYNVLTACFPATNHETLAVGFFSVENFRSKLRFADNVFCLRYKETPHYARWVDLHSRLESASGERNSLAHYSVLHYPNEIPGRRCGLLPRLSSPRRKPSKRPQKTPPGSLFVRDVALRARQFAALSNALLNLAAELHGYPRPLPESLEQSERPPTLEQLRLQMHAMLGCLPQSSRQ